MKKSIKPCINNVITALRACASFHSAAFEDWSDEGQIGIEGETIPILADVRSILQSFYKPEFVECEQGWGYTTAYLYGEDINPFKEKVDEERLLMALPYRAKMNWEMV